MATSSRGVEGGKLQVQVSLKSSAISIPCSSMSGLLTIGEVSRRSGVASSALRFYEDRGLITSERREGGQRRYPRHVLRRIAFIVFAQRIGLTLTQIGAELAKLDPQPRTQPPRLVAALRDLGREDRRADRGARTPPDRADRMHRLRLPLTRPLLARQPRRPRRRAGPGPRYWIGDLQPP